MKELGIKLPRQGYLPGEMIKGKVVLKSDLNFSFEKVSVSIVGHMIHTYVAAKSKGKRGLSTEVRDRTWGLHEETSEIAENMALYIGTSEFPFEFQIPDHLIPSYATSTLVIAYHIHATMVVTGKEVLNAISEITLLHSIAELPDEPIEASAPHDFTDKSLIVRLDSQKLCIGESVLFDYYIGTDMKFNALRAEIEHTEKLTKKTTRVIIKREIPSDELTRHEWKKLGLFSEKPIPPSISIDELQSSLVLRVTLVRKLNLDQSVTISLVAGHCLKQGWNEHQEEDAVQLPPIYMRQPTPPKPAAEVTLSDKERVAHNWYKKAVSFKEFGEIDQALMSIETSLKWAPDSEQALALRDELVWLKEHGE